MHRRLQQLNPFKTATCAALLAVVTMLGSLPAWGSDPSSSPTAERQPREKTFLKRRWGIEVEFVRLTAAGYMLEFRFRVLDADKAAPLFDKKSIPVLEHVQSGARMMVPAPSKVGALRNANPPEDGKIYWMFFANPGTFIKKGEQVDIEVGRFKVENLTVE